MLVAIAPRNPVQFSNMSLLTKFLSIYYKSGLRGSFRLTDYLSHRLKALQCIPIETDSGTLYGDLRNTSSRTYLANPKSQSGEDVVMQNLVNRNDVVIDVGAHLGFYTLLLSQLVGKNGKVFAFEPNPELLSNLRVTIEPLVNVELFTIALSDRKSKVNLFVPEEDASMASLSDWTDGIVGNVHQVSCETQRLDDLVDEGRMPIPQFIKCDVEGAELSVFHGGIKTLNRVDAPIIMFEVNAKAAHAFGKTTNSFFNFLESLEQPEYNFFEVLSNGIQKLKSTEIEFTNIVAVPKIKQDLYQKFLP